VRVPASSANLGPGFDVLALALDLHLTVESRESATTTITWKGEGAGEVPLNRKNLIVRAAEEPFKGWSRPLTGLELRIRNDIPIGRGLGSSAAAIVGGVLLGAKLRGLRMPAQRILELAIPLEGHGDNLAAALYGGFCIAVLENGGVRVHRLDWPPRWRAVLFVPNDVSPTHEARRLDTFEISIEPDQDCCTLFVPRHPATRMSERDVGAAEARLDVERLVARGVAGAALETFEFPARAHAVV